MLTQILLLMASMVSTLHSLQYPVGLDPSLCPNYPFCGDSPPVTVLQKYRRRYPADLDPSSCPNYPYCHHDIFRQVSSVSLPDSAYPTGVDPSLCPNYPFCGDSPPVYSYPRRYPADVDPSSCPYYPYCHQDIFRKVLPVHKVRPIILPASAYPTGLDPFLCPNYPFCGDPPRE